MKKQEVGQKQKPFVPDLLDWIDLLEFFMDREAANIPKPLKIASFRDRSRKGV